MTYIVHSASYEETLLLGKQIGANLRGGEVIELIGDLGSGKTAFTRGINEGLGGQEVVSSPSFALHNEYQTPSLRIDHLDFYRLNEAGIMSEELSELLCQPDGVVVIEWGDVVVDILPKSRMVLSYVTAGENARVVTITYNKLNEYMLSGVVA
jgi:tRNA threonylcarbamoyladenosine biosynthesis protein TsaE